jgi:hypothetical protein
MEILNLGEQSAERLEQAARLLVEHFDEPLDWPDIDSARNEVGRCWPAVLTSDRRF